MIRFKNFSSRNNTFFSFNNCRLEKVFQLKQLYVMSKNREVVQQNEIIFCKKDTVSPRPGTGYGIHGSRCSVIGMSRSNVHIFLLAATYSSDIELDYDSLALFFSIQFFVLTTHVLQ
jgi:hypothetical protein